MKVVDVHPEHLLDRLELGELTDDERARLDEHLEGCSVCRLDVLLRIDFERESGEFDDRALNASVTGALAALRVPGAESPRVGSDPPAPSAVGSAHRRPLPLPIRWLATVAALATVFATGIAAAKSGAIERILLAVSGRAAPVAASPSEADGPRSAAVGVSESTGTRPRVEASDGGASQVEEPAAGSLNGVDAASSARPESASPRGAAPNPGSSESERPCSTAASCFEAAGRARLHHSAAAASLYRLLVARFPGSREASVGRVILARMQFDRGDFASALQAYDAYLAAGRGPLDEEACAGRALALGRLGRTADERAAWRLLLERYPRSSFGELARRRVVLDSPAQPVASGLSSELPPSSEPM